jgi:hypothetical protein
LVSPAPWAFERKKRPQYDQGQGADQEGSEDLPDLVDHLFLVESEEKRDGEIDNRGESGAGSRKVRADPHLKSRRRRPRDGQEWSDGQYDDDAQDPAEQGADPAGEMLNGASRAGEAMIPKGMPIP